MKQFVLICFSLLLIISCTKKVGADLEGAYSDAALFDSAHHQNYTYYKNDSLTLLPGTHGPHGTFKLRFNSIAYRALIDTGKLPVKGKFPDGSFLVKDVYKNGVLDIYAYMYKRNGNWLWGEVHSNGKFEYRIKDGAAVCLGCHTQPGNRDNAVSFNFY